MIDSGFLADPKDKSLEVERNKVAVGEPGRPTASLRQCPRCGEAGLAKLEGCDTCYYCGYSKCA